MVISTLRAVKHGLERALSALQRQRRAAELERTAPHATRARIAADLKQLGIAEGDVLFLHSSLKSLGFVEGGPSTVIDALLDAIGPRGTLLLPAYWIPGGTLLATCELPDYVFDVRNHGTHMGALPAAFLQRQGVRRSVHPTHSCAAVGPAAEYLTEAHHRAPSVFGEGSPWQRFSTLPEGKVLGLGISMGPVTIYHRVEDEMGRDFPVPVWLERTYELPSIDHDGRRWAVPVRPFVPEIVQRRIDQKGRDDLREWFARDFSAAGIKVNGRVAQADAWFVRGQDFMERMRVLAKRGITIYSTPEELAQAHVGS
jgi:aminoglycoside 3-N-acetyltransferase